MRHLITAIKTVRHTNEFIFPRLFDCGFVSSLIVRNVSTQKKLKWIEPIKLPFYHPKNTGDLDCITLPKDEELLDLFSKNEMLSSCANDAVKKIFSVRNQRKKRVFEMYKRELIDLVRSHQFDNSSREVNIAQLTAKIRFYQYLLEQCPSNKKWRHSLNTLILKRHSKLTQLREIDYKKFEWILEKLNLQFKPLPTDNKKIWRNKSLELLAKLEAAKLKEEKLSEYKKNLDQQKIPFLEKKLEKLKWIQEQEKLYNLETTISNSDIENCIKTLEKVKLEIQERQKEGYLRKVHPYTLEVYKPKVQQVAEN